MGCTESCHRGAAACDTVMELEGTDRYSFGRSVGSGTFGMVYKATERNSQEDCAVKVVNLKQTPTDKFQQEALMLTKLKHPRIANIHGVYYQWSSGFLVMDLYKGGSALTGMQSHWTRKGSIPIPVVQNVVQMMVEAVEWLHQNNVIHRDVKADNFLLDRPHIEHPECQVVLSDFGTARPMVEGQRFHKLVGTTRYWAPEVFQRDYGLASDAFALGVVAFAMIWRVFPKHDMGRQCPAGLSADGEDFVLGLLERSEDERCTVEKALSHAFLSGPGRDLNAESATGRPRRSFSKEHGAKNCGSKALFEPCNGAGSIGSVTTATPRHSLSSTSMGSMQEVASFLTAASEPSM